MQNTEYFWDCFALLFLTQAVLYTPENHRERSPLGSVQLSAIILSIWHFPYLLKQTMSDQFKEILDIPRDFLHDGTQFMNRFTSFSVPQPLRIEILISDTDAQSVSHSKIA